MSVQKCCKLFFNPVAEFQLQRVHRAFRFSIYFLSLFNIISVNFFQNHLSLK